MKSFKRKLYKRGSSFETTIPAPLLFTLDSNKRYFVVFKFDSAANKWNIEFEECKDNNSVKENNTRSNSTRNKEKNNTKDKEKNENQNT